MNNPETLTIKNPLGKSLDKVSRLINSLPIAASYNKLDCLENGKPCDYIFCSVNEAFEKLTHKTKEQVLGKKASEVIPQENGGLSDRIGILANVALTGVPAETERFIKEFQKWVHIYVYSPETGYFLVLMEDVTHRKHLESALGLSLQNLKQLSLTENGLWILDPKGLTTYVNTKMANMLGYTIKEMTGVPFLSFLDEHSKIIAVDTGLPFKVFKDKHLELQFIHNSGSPVYAQVEAAQISDDLGESLGVVLNVIDVSERKRVEQALMKSQKKYSGLFQHLTDGFACCQVLFDHSGNPIDYVFSDVNNAFRQLTGLRDKPLLGKKVSQILPLISEQFPDWLQIYSKVSSKGKSLILEKYSPTFDRWLSIHVYCPEDGYIAVILQDITQRKKTLSALKQAKNSTKNLLTALMTCFLLSIRH